MKRPPKPTPTNKGAYAVVKDRGKRASMMLVGQVMDNGDSATTSPVRSGPNEA